LWVLENEDCPRSEGISVRLSRDRQEAFPGDGRICGLGNEVYLLTPSRRSRQVQAGSGHPKPEENTVGSRNPTHPQLGVQDERMCEILIFQFRVSGLPIIVIPLKGF